MRTITAEMITFLAKAKTTQHFSLTTSITAIERQMVSSPSFYLQLPKQIHQEKSN
jgi:hypothetical protein